ncbi:MAG TPA: hypothetical protein VN709_05135 [Terriglobales bacterium]|nr:hypothetical protein [Terriglobales bacterium]
MRPHLAVLVLALALNFAPGLAAQAPPLVAVQAAVNNLQTAVAALDPATLHGNAEQKQALAAGQASLQRNLQNAVPGLMTAWQAAPQDASVGFRLYRDLEAVLTVAQRESDAGAASLAPSADQLRTAIDQLGDWVEAQSAAQFTELTRDRQQLAAAAAKVAPAQAPPPPLVISDANGTSSGASHATSKPASKTKPAAKPKTSSPPACCN